jgi:hypothetical protein
MENKSLISSLKNLLLSSRILYHGSPYNFDKFDINKVGSGYTAANEFNISGADGYGLYLTNDIEYAKFYALEHLEDPYFSKLTQDTNTGYLYEIESPDDEYFIQGWEKLNKQSQIVQNSLHKIAKYKPEFIKYIYDNPKWQNFLDISGSQFIINIKKKFFNNDIKKTSQFLNRYQIYGIQSSEDDTHDSYIIFNSDELEIVKKTPISVN